MPIAETLLASLAAKALEKAADALIDLRKESRAERVTIDDAQCRTCLVAHIMSVEAWSGSITLLSLLRDKDLRDSFVELSLDVGLRRHTRMLNRRTTTTVDEVSALAGHCVVLGRPGAGKTTSLQRIAQTALAKWASGRGGVPLLVRLRDLREGDSLVGHLLGIVGLDVRVPPRMTPQMRRAWERRALLRYLSSIAAVLLIDGLDEVPSGIRIDVEADIREIVGFPGDHRVFVTCRTADYSSPLPNVQVFTILPLSQPRVAEFAQRWLKEQADSFMQALTSNPYAGAEVVPLTLAHLCAIYERDGELPPRPIDVYEQIVSLLVEEWDKQRRVVRSSRYADFSWRKKERFLQAAAYHLAMRGRKGSFRDDDLQLVYPDIAQEFNLPRDEAPEVIHELESHTGLVHEVGFRQYDFVHLAIQEYLAAMYAHRRANAIGNLVPRFPNEMALVLAYSTSADEHLEQVLTELLKYPPDLVSEFVVPFLARLAVEKPAWMPSERLGWVMLAFLDQAGRHARRVDDRGRPRLPQETRDLLTDPRIVSSIRSASAGAELFEEVYSFRLIPTPAADLPPFLRTFLTGRHEAGLQLIKFEVRLTSLLVPGRPKRRRKKAE